ncbi:MAG: phenylacetate--CoA ligase family protein [Candidatus Njordarchaeales archaeon]
MFDSLKIFIVDQMLRRVSSKLLRMSYEEVKKRITKIDWKTIQTIQKYKLLKTLRFAAQNSPYYRDKIKSISKKISSGNMFDVLRQLSFTTPAEVSRDPESFLAIPYSDVITFHFTAGTTGKRKKIFLSKKDLDKLIYYYSLGFVIHDLNKLDVAQIMYSFGTWQVGNMFQEACERIGLKYLPTGNHISFKEQEESMKEFKVTITLGTPSYIYRLASEIELPTTIRDNMKFHLLGGEPLSKKAKHAIESNLGGEVYMGYGLMEFGGGFSSECEYHQGYHIFPSVYPEIIDIKTGELVEKEEWGELVLTSLDKQAMPLIRYRTGDITRFIDGECECGLKLPRLDYIRGRTDDRITIGTAEKYYPIVFDEIFDSIDTVKDYQIVVLRENGRDLLKVFVVANSPSDKLKQEILRKFYEIETLRIDIESTRTVSPPEIIFVNSIEKKGLKERKIIDKRSFI